MELCYPSYAHVLCRAPQGARGLKSTGIDHLAVNALSRPVRGARIEMFRQNHHYDDGVWSRPVRGARIEIGTLEVG